MPTAVNIKQGVMLAYIMVPAALIIPLLALIIMSTNTWMIGFCSRASMNINYCHLNYNKKLNSISIIALDNSSFCLKSYTSKLLTLSGCIIRYN